MMSASCIGVVRGAHHQNCIKSASSTLDISAAVECMNT
jgi:hypothetical protein